MKQELIDKLVLLYLEKNFDKFNSPEELKDLYYKTEKEIKEYKSPYHKDPDYFSIKKKK